VPFTETENCTRVTTLYGVGARVLKSEEDTRAQRRGMDLGEMAQDTADDGGMDGQGRC
jgi:hypothetical protein